MCAFVYVCLFLPMPLGASPSRRAAGRPTALEAVEGLNGEVQQAGSHLRRQLEGLSRAHLGTHGSLRNAVEHKDRSRQLKMPRPQHSAKRAGGTASASEASALPAFREPPSRAFAAGSNPCPPVCFPTLAQSARATRPQTATSARSTSDVPPNRMPEARGSLLTKTQAKKMFAASALPQGWREEAEIERFGSTVLIAARATSPGLPRPLSAALSLAIPRPATARDPVLEQSESQVFDWPWPTPGISLAEHLRALDSPDFRPAPRPPSPEQIRVGASPPLYACIATTLTSFETRSKPERLVDDAHLPVPSPQARASTQVPRGANPVRVEPHGSRPASGSRGTAGGRASRPVPRPDPSLLGEVTDQPLRRQELRGLLEPNGGATSPAVVSVYAKDMGIKPIGHGGLTGSGLRSSGRRHKHGAPGVLELGGVLQVSKAGI